MNREGHGDECDAGANLLTVISMKGAEGVKLPWRINRKMRYGTQSLWVNYLNNPMRSDTGWRVYCAWQ